MLLSLPLSPSTSSSTLPVSFPLGGGSNGASPCDTPSHPLIPKKRGDQVWVCILNSWGQVHLEPLHAIPYHAPIPTAFPNEPCYHGNESTLSSTLLTHLVYLEYHCFRCVWNPFKKMFVSTNVWKDPAWSSWSTTFPRFQQFKKTGLSAPHVQQRFRLFQWNDIHVPEPSTLALLFNEVLHPFYIFQLFSILLWSLDDYYIYASCILAISIISTIFTLVETKHNIKRLRELSHFTCNVHVLRDGQWQLTSSQTLVPGDMFEINMQDFLVFPCDALLLSGDCIVDESMLTGESVPVSKIHAMDTSILSDMEMHEPQVSKQLHKSFLYSGTRLIRVRNDIEEETSLGKTTTTTPSASSPNQVGKGKAGGMHHEKSKMVLALVVRTGFNTSKGSLIRSMLFPKPHYFKFYKDSFKFVGILSIFGALGFCFSLYNFIKLGSSPELVAKRAFDVITLIVPPILPAAMSVGTTLAIRRLKAKKVFCISPNHVNVGGKVSLVCFDKTGTLTEHGLGVLGVHLASGSSFTKLYTTPHTLPHPLAIEVLASCHELKLHNNVLLGDPLDTKMFEWVGWRLEETVFSTTVMSPPSMPLQEIAIVKQFEFRSELRRMSVLTRKIKSEFNLFCKGAPESLKHICVPSSLPLDFDERLTSLSHRGFRVLGFAVRSFPSSQWNMVKLEKATRMELESELQFLGFLVFENKLKQGSGEAIDTLKNAKIRCVMCTGDHVFTAINISRESGIVDKENDVYLPTLIRDPDQGHRISGIQWTALEGNDKWLDPMTLLPLTTTTTTTTTTMNSTSSSSYIQENPMEKRQVNEKMDPLSPTHHHPSMSTSIMGKATEITGSSVVTTLTAVGPYALAMTGEVFDYLMECEQLAKDELEMKKHDEADTPSFHYPPASSHDASVSPMPSPFYPWKRKTSEDELIKLTPSSTTAGTRTGLTTTPVSITATSSSSSSSSSATDFLHRLGRILYKTQIFARMNPEQKQLLVEKFQSMEYCVAFCGDGANDCGALKAADIGLSLSESEASVAAPFTSSHPNVMCMIDLIKEGRAALVTSFSSFKYIALYSFIQFFSVTLLYTVKSNLGDLQFFYIDLILIWPLTFTMGRSGAYQTLVAKCPTATLLSKKILTSLTGHVLLQFLFQLGLYFHVSTMSSFYTPSTADPEEQEVTCYENTVLFLFTSYLYITEAICFSVGPPYRAPLYHNSFFMISMSVLFLMNTLLLFFNNDFFTTHFHLLPLPLSYQGFIFGIVVVHFAMTWLFEKYLHVPIAMYIQRLIRQCKVSCWQCFQKHGHRSHRLYCSSKKEEGSLPHESDLVVCPSSSSSSSSSSPFHTSHPPTQKPWKMMASSPHRVPKLYKQMAKVFEKYE
ncbi:hypothetical protein HMI54_003377 [Coelomomyces lativittatus]|nr:hypothetical protein HMI56_000779 [Coelomomyces lativittatus]KAJ1508234.1 hypothetical protein HMI54_003377 [Coelomomyces lativittatus]KAJ1508433.1 hypothetical protein HMI55_000377 [Coelomomyces lativittatus]